jgi:hypothetical protein
MMKNESTNKYKKLSIILGIVAAILLITTVISFFRVRTVVIDNRSKTEINQTLQFELDTLLFNHEQIKVEYGELSIELEEKDSIIQANADEIRRLIARQADYNKIKKKLDLLRGISQDYVQRIDSLYRVNEELVVENKRMKEDVRRFQQTATDLEMVTDSLQSKIQTASRFKAYGISAKTIYLRSGGKREVETDRLRRTQQIKIRFTLSENLVVEPGKKDVYCRIARPDGKVLYKSDSEDHSFVADGERLQYSIKQSIDFDKKAKSVTLIWDVDDAKSELIAGRYYAMIYVDGYQIGETSFDLK